MLSLMLMLIVDAGDAVVVDADADGWFLIAG